MEWSGHLLKASSEGQNTSVVSSTTRGAVLCGHCSRGIIPLVCSWKALMSVDEDIERVKNIRSRADHKVISTTAILCCPNYYFADCASSHMTRELISMVWTQWSLTRQYIENESENLWIIWLPRDDYAHGSSPPSWAVVSSICRSTQKWCSN